MTASHYNPDVAHSQIAAILTQALAVEESNRQANEFCESPLGLGQTKQVKSEFEPSIAVKSTRAPIGRPIPASRLTSIRRATRLRQATRKPIRTAPAGKSSAPKTELVSSFRQFVDPTVIINIASAILIGVFFFSLVRSPAFDVTKVEPLSGPVPHQTSKQPEPNSLPNVVVAKREETPKGNASKSAGTPTPPRRKPAGVEVQSHTTVAKPTLKSYPPPIFLRYPKGMQVLFPEDGSLRQPQRGT